MGLKLKLMFLLAFFFLSYKDELDDYIVCRDRAFTHDYLHFLVCLQENIKKFKTFIRGLKTSRTRELIYLSNMIFHLNIYSLYFYINNFAIKNLFICAVVKIHKKLKFLEYWMLFVMFLIFIYLKCFLIFSLK